MGARAMEELTAGDWRGLPLGAPRLGCRGATRSCPVPAPLAAVVRDKAGALFIGVLEGAKDVDYLSEAVGKVRGQTEEAPTAE